MSSGDEQGEQPDNWDAYLDGTLDNTDVPSSQRLEFEAEERGHQMANRLSELFGHITTREVFDDRTLPGDMCPTCHDARVLRFDGDTAPCPTCTGRWAATG